MMAATQTTAADWLELRERTIRTVWPDGGGALPSTMQPRSSTSNYKGFPDLTQLVWNVSCAFFSLNSTVTTTLSAALDARIALSFPIAGSIPLDFHHKSWDYEQQPRPGDKLWYLGVANYTQLYALAAIDANGTRDNRASLQVLHERDPCCFYGRGRHERIKAYDAAISAAVASLPARRRVSFSTAITNWSLHAVCQMDRVVIATAKAQFDDHRERPFENLPCDVLRSASLPCPYTPNTVA